MSIIKKNIFLYTVIIIIPTILAVLSFKQYLEVKEQRNLEQDTLKSGELHQQYIQTLVKETVKSLDVLSIVIQDFMQDTEDVTTLLEQTKKTDKRYGEIYLADKEGVIITGTVDRYNGKKVREGYIKSCTALKTAQISVLKEDNAQDYVSICKPVLDEHESISSFILVQLKLGYIQNVLELLTPQIAVKITDQKGEEILTINKGLQEGDFQQSIPFDDIPWTLHLNHPDQDVDINANALLKFTVVFLMVAHLAFLVVQFVLLQRESDKQKKMHESQKLKILGTLAATTAHEIKNPLTGIKGLVQLLSEKYNDSEDQMYFSVIQQEITRINEIVNEFLILGKPSIHPLETVDIAAVINEMLPMLEAESCTKGTTLYIENSEQALLVLCLKDQIKQVILNITKNSFEACELGDQVSIYVAAKHSSAVITIEDNGPGMSKSTLKRIFEPFYTTKNYGTGLGLYICQKIIANYKGTISVKSSKYTGTTFTIVLPLIQSDAQKQ
ncbi:MAG: ATP-binding protein [Bacillus sp. (in: firmicutes)]